MFDKEVNATDEVVCTYKIPVLLKRLMLVALPLMFLIVLLSLGISVTGWTERHSFYLVLLGLVGACAGIKGMFSILTLWNPVQLVLSREKIAVRRGSKTYTAPWNALDPFEWDDKKFCLRAKIVGTDVADGAKDGYFFILPSFEKKDVPTLLKEMAAVQKSGVL